MRGWYTPAMEDDKSTFRQRAERNTSIIVLPSNDPNVLPGSTASAFELKLGDVLVFDEPHSWQVALVDITFGNPVLPGEVYVNCDLTSRIITGSEQTQNIFIIPTDAAIVGRRSVTQTGSITRWQPISKRVVGTIAISLTDATGAPVVPVAGVNTIVTLAVRHAP